MIFVLEGYFGGVAFKCQRIVEPQMLGKAAKIATNYMDVITTSGPGIGHEPDLKKIRIMKEAIGDFPLPSIAGSIAKI